VDVPLSEAALQLTESDVLEVDRELSKRSLMDFVKLSWDLVEPARPYVHNWHAEAICEHLEAVTRGEIQRLLINVPPGMTKSLFTRVFWPMWEWGPRNIPHFRYIGASYAQDLSMRDNLRARRVFLSEWYQARWDIALTDDQNAKLKFENEHTGFMAAMAAESLTGERGDRVVIDDPHSVKGAISDAKRNSTITWFSETVPTRLNDPDRSAIVVIMQRLHGNDVSGYIISNDLGYEKLILPMEYEERQTRVYMGDDGEEKKEEVGGPCTTCLGIVDPRRTEGQLLFDQRFPRNVVERDKKIMGTVATAGQFQQRPTPRGGGQVEVDKLEITVAPAKLRRLVRYWDKAGTQGGGAYTCGVLMGVEGTGDDLTYWVLDVVRGQWGSQVRERMIRQTAEMDGRAVLIWVEQEPGSGGKESAENTVRRLAGFVCKPDRVTGAKPVRCEPLCNQVDAGNVKVKRAPWNRDFVEEGRTYPAGTFKDQWDAAGGAFNKLSAKRVARNLRK